MQPLLKWTLLLLHLTAMTSTAAADAPSPYCYRNITETSYKVVTKTRLKTVSSKGFFKKITFKKETQVEVYEDQEPVYKIKLELHCCEGYKLTDLDLCEPQCVKNGCPQHSLCVEPEVCECAKGYFSNRSEQDGVHYCEPICEKPCPEHSVCVAPNECACKKGFHVTKDQQCRPFCLSGCPHEGHCVAPNVCECQEGYKAERGSCVTICSFGSKWNHETLECESSKGEWMLSTNYPDLEEPQEPTESIEVETDIESSNDDIDPNEVFDENIESTTFSAWTDEYGSTTYSSALDGKQECPPNYVFHKGQCRPLKFVSNEIDCWLRPCQDHHAVCLDNGTCACTEGFKPFITHVVDHDTLEQTTQTECLTMAEYEVKLQELEESPKAALQEPINWTMIFFIILGVSIMISAVAFVGFKLLYVRKPEVDVEGKTLTCAYKHRGCSETVKSVI